MHRSLIASCLQLEFCSCFVVGRLGPQETMERIKQDNRTASIFGQPGNTDSSTFIIDPECKDESDRRQSSKAIASTLPCPPPPPPSDALHSTPSTPILSMPRPLENQPLGTTNCEPPPLPESQIHVCVYVWGIFAHRSLHPADLQTS